MTPARIDRRERMAQQTRQDILATARRLFAERGYVHTSINDIAEEAGVAVQTIYDRLGSKRGMLAGLIELIDDESGVRENGAAVLAANNPTDALRAQIRVTRGLQERCGDIIGALLAAAPVEHDLADAVVEGLRRHRNGARMAIDGIDRFHGLRDDLPPDQAAALLAAATTHEAWRELVEANNLTWDQAEHTLTLALGRALLTSRKPHPGDPVRTTVGDRGRVKSGSEEGQAQQCARPIRRRPSAPTTLAGAAEEQRQRQGMAGD